jgi:two-component system chemotaxis response regulator CheY
MRILVVDDDRINRKFLGAMLTGVGEIDMATNGREAIDAVKKSLSESKPFDIIFLDIMMPDLNGIEALQEIRKVEESQGIRLNEGTKIVMVTALADKQNVLSAFSKGCEYYLVKPVQQAKMFELLEEMGHDISVGH